MYGRVVILFILLALVGLALTAGLAGCGKSAREVAREKCYRIQKSIEGAIKAFYAATGRYPKSLDDLSSVKYLKGVVSPCPSRGKYIFLSGNPPQVKCSIHGFYK